MEQEGNQGLIFSIICLASLCFVIILLIIIFQKKKNVLLLKQIEDRKNFEKEIVESQIEIREQTLRNISWELHDNIGQLLTLAKIQLQKIENADTTEVNDNLTQILGEVRSLSKVTNPDFVTQSTLDEAVKIEIERLNRINYIKASLEIENKPFHIDSKAEIILFRIIQEFISNTIKHSKASQLFVKIIYETRTKTVNIRLSDDGKGFDIENTKNNGIGLLNIKKRANLIHAKLDLTSEINNGTQIKISYDDKVYNK